MKDSLPLASRVVAVTAESPRIRTLELDRELEAEPGQFVMAWLPGVDEKPFSLARAAPVSPSAFRLRPRLFSAGTWVPPDASNAFLYSSAACLYCCCP